MLSDWSRRRIEKESAAGKMNVVMLELKKTFRWQMKFSVWTTVWLPLTVCITKRRAVPALELRAGPPHLSAEGDLRYIRFGERDSRRVYVAFRDLNWDTVLPCSSILVNRTMPTFMSLTRPSMAGEPIPNSDRYDQRGRPRTITFTMEGEACLTFHATAFTVLAVLHPTPRVRRVRPKSSGTVGGAQARGGSLIHLTAPAVHNDAGHLAEVAPRAEVRFEGDTFEMENNATDASV